MTTDWWSPRMVRWCASTWGTGISPRRKQRRSKPSTSNISILFELSPTLRCSGASGQWQRSEEEAVPVVRHPLGDLAAVTRRGRVSETGRNDGELRAPGAGPERYPSRLADAKGQAQ